MHTLEQSKFETRLSKESDILSYFSRANKFMLEIMEQIESEEKEQKNQKKNRGNKSGPFFVHERIEELIEMYITVYKLECNELCNGKHQKYKV